MSFLSSADGALSPRTDISAQSSRQTASALPHQDSRPSLRVAGERARGTGPTLVSEGAVSAATDATLRRLTGVLNEMDPIGTGALQRLHELCIQLHTSQGAIDDATNPQLNVAPVPGFRRAAPASTVGCRVARKK